MTKSIAKKSTTRSLPPAVPLAITPTFSPWTHTSDDSYIYQLSLVLATATVSLIPLITTYNTLNCEYYYCIQHSTSHAAYERSGGRQSGPPRSALVHTYCCTETGSVTQVNHDSVQQYLPRTCYYTSHTSTTILCTATAVFFIYCSSSLEHRTRQPYQNAT